MLVSNAGNINACDCLVTLWEPNLFAAGVEIVDFAEGAMFNFASNPMLATQLGTTGKLAAGSVPVLNSVEIHLLASSRSNRVFEAIGSQMAIMDGNIYPLMVRFELIGAKKAFTIKDGFYSTPQQGITATNVLQPYTHTIQYSSRNFSWEDLAS